MIKVLADILLGIIILIGIVIFLGVLIEVVKNFFKTFILRKRGNLRWNMKKQRENSKAINSLKYEPKHSWKKFID